MIIIRRRRRTCHQMDFAIPAIPQRGILPFYRMKIEEKRLILGSCQRTKKIVKYECDSDISCSWYAWSSSQRFQKSL